MFIIVMTTLQLLKSSNFSQFMCVNKENLEFHHTFVFLRMSMLALKLLTCAPTGIK